MAMEFGGIEQKRDENLLEILARILPEFLLVVVFILVY